MLNNEHPMPNDTSSDDKYAKYAEVMPDMTKSREERRREFMEAAIADNPDKEPFDYEKFSKLYWRQDVQGDIDGSESTEVQDGYDLDYYLSFPGAQTIEEYAQMRQERDRQDIR